MRGRFLSGGLPLLAALAAGGAVRIWGLGSLPLAGDEWHAVNKLLDSGFFAIATDFGKLDHSIPLTLFYKALAETVGLTEWWMRAPSLLFGLAALLLVPWLMRDAIGRQAGSVLAFLLAISPIHIHYSRLARPYAILFLLETLALVSFWGWLETGDRGRLALCAGAFTAGVWLNLSMGPLLPAVVVAGAVALVARRDTGSARFGALFWATLALALGPLLLSLPPLLGNPSAVSGKVAEGAIAWTTLPWSFQLVLGTAAWHLLMALTALLALGAWDLEARERPIWNFFAVAAAVHVTLVVAAGPHRISAGPAFVRYSVFIVPLTLALAARGLVAAGRRLPWRAGFPLLPAVALLPCLILWGPLPDIWRRPYLTALQDDYRHRELLERIERLSLPRFYSDPSGPRPDAILVEAPYYFFWNHIPFYQAVHGRTSLPGFVAAPSTRRPGEIPLGSRKVRLAHGVHVGDPARLRDLKIDMVVFHKRLHQEFPGPYTLTPIDVDPWIAVYRRRYGQPVYEDSTLAVFQLRR